MKENKNTVGGWVRNSLFLAAIVLLLLGVFRSDHIDVKNKAVRICYECIGIG